MSYFQLMHSHVTPHQKNVNDISLNPAIYVNKGVRSHIQIFLIWLKWEILW